MNYYYGQASAVSLELTYSNGLEAHLDSQSSGSTRVRRGDKTTDYFWEANTDGSDVALQRVMVADCESCPMREKPDHTSIELTVELDADATVPYPEYVDAAFEGSVTPIANRKGRIVDLRVEGKFASDAIAEQSAGTCKSKSEFCSLDTEFLDKAITDLDTHYRSKRNGGLTRFKRLDHCPPTELIKCDELDEVQQMAEISACAYTKPQDCGNGWELVKPEDLGIPSHLFNEPDGFSASMYYNASEDRYVLTFAGTNQASDWWDNVGQATTSLAEQYDAAELLARSLTNYMSSERLHITGHSLGGGLATVAAIRLNRPATVFNAAGLTRTTARRLGLDYSLAEQLIHAYNVDGEPLTAAQTPPSRDFSIFDDDRDYSPHASDTFNENSLIHVPGVHTRLPALGASQIPQGLNWIKRLIYVHGHQAVLQSIGTAQRNCAGGIYAP